MWNIFKSKRAKESTSTGSQIITRNTSPSIKIEDIYPFNNIITVGLNIETGRNHPITVGCSIKALNGQIIDVPAKQLQSSGLVIWDIKLTNANRTNPNILHSGWSGQIIFALWEDDSFQKRLTDTDWVSWEIPWQNFQAHFGSKSANDIRHKYANAVARWLLQPLGG